MKVKLDRSKVLYNGNSFVVVFTEEELKTRFSELQKKIAEDKDDESQLYKRRED